MTPIPTTTPPPPPSATQEPPVPMDTRVDPTVSGDIYTLDLGNNTTFVANGTSGRITQLNFNGTNLLTDETVNELNYGSSFWTSPQSTWNWPPPLDATAYTHQIDGKSILFTSAATAQADETVSITKRFSADAASGQLFLEYTIKNEGSAAISVAPWEVSRFRASGLSFYPTGTSVTQAELKTTDMAGITWLDYDTAGVDGSGLKNSTDGSEGWLAHVDQDVLFIKVFPDIPAGSEAPGQGEVEIYVDGARAYTELEQQGALVTLEPGAISEPWRVTWLVRALPPEVPATLGSQALADHVRSLIQRAP